MLLLNELGDVYSKMILESLVDVKPDFVHIQLLLDPEYLECWAQTRVEHEFEVDRRERVQFIQIEDVKQESNFIFEFAIAEYYQATE